MFKKLKELALHKLGTRLIAWVALLGAGHVVVALGNPAVQAVLSHIFKDPTLQPDAKSYIEKALIGLLGLAWSGEIAYYWAHKKLILPKVLPPANRQGGM